MEQNLQDIQISGTISPEHTVLFERAPLSVPLNLREWVQPDCLSRWVREAITNLNPTQPLVVRFLQYPAAERPEAILRVLLFSYCTQLYSASEIAAACHTEPFIRELCENKPLFPDELEKFLHKNRPLLEQLIWKLLVRAVHEKFVPQGELPPGLQHSLRDRAADRVLSALLMDGPER